MSRTTAQAVRGAPQRMAQGRHRPPARAQMTEMPFEPQRSAGRMWTQPTQAVQPPPAARRELRASRASRACMYAFFALVLVLCFAQIGQLARMAQNTKQIAALADTIREKKGEAGDLNTRLSMRRNIKRVHDEAVYRLGMIQPGEGQIRVIAPVGSSAAAQQTAMLAE